MPGFSKFAVVLCQGFPKYVFIAQYQDKTERKCFSIHLVSTILFLLLYTQYILQCTFYYCVLKLSVRQIQSTNICISIKNKNNPPSSLIWGHLPQKAGRRMTGLYRQHGELFIDCTEFCVKCTLQGGSISDYFKYFMHLHVVCSSSGYNWGNAKFLAKNKSWEFAHRFFEQIAHFLGAKERKSDLLGKRAKK